MFQRDQSPGHHWHVGFAGNSSDNTGLEQSFPTMSPFSTAGHLCLQRLSTKPHLLGNRTSNQQDILMVTQPIWFNFIQRQADFSIGINLLRNWVLTVSIFLQWAPRRSRTSGWQQFVCDMDGRANAKHLKNWIIQHHESTYSPFPRSTSNLLITPFHTELSRGYPEKEDT